MTKLYIIGGSVRDCYSIATDHGIPTSKATPIYSLDHLDLIKENVFAICTSKVDADSVKIAHAAHQNPLFTIVDEVDATNFINRVKEVVNRATKKALTQAKEINHARNIIEDELKVFDPKDYLDIGLGIDGKVTIYSLNSWTNGLMTLVNAH